MDPLILSHVVLWVVQVITVLTLLALARQVGLLHLRLRPIGPGSLEEGVPVGIHVDLSNARSLAGKPLEVWGDSDLAIVLFVSPQCSLCKTVLEGARRLQKTERELSVIPAVDNEAGKGMAYLRKYRFDDGLNLDDLKSIQVPTR